MAEWFSADGSIDPAAFQSWQDLDKFLVEEASIWSSYSAEDLSPGARSIVETTQSAIRRTRSSFQNLRGAGHNVAAGIKGVVSLLDTGEGALSSQVMKSSLYLDISKTAGRSSALFHIGFKQGLVSLADARHRDDIVGALWEVAPGLQRTSELASLLTKEREGTRRTMRAEIDRLKMSDSERLGEWEQCLQDAKEAYVGWARRRSTRWGRLTRSWDERHRESERRIRSVEETYREHMGLKAPVEYWTSKAEQHAKAEFWARIWVLAFFALTLPGMAYAFVEVGQALIQKALEVRPAGSAPFPNAIFLIASAGLASCAGLVFWAGRLLTKLYLSQHHLRQDAAERATMTETYLALIENSAASTDDRQIILNALFRNTPDGIVKEEGGLDPSIAAALGKFLAKP